MKSREVICILQKYMNSQVNREEQMSLPQRGAIADRVRKLHRQGLTRSQIYKRLQKTDLETSYQYIYVLTREEQHKDALKRLQKGQ